MNTPQAAGSLLRFAGFLLFIAAGALFFMSGEFNITLVTSASVLFIAGLVIGIKHRTPRS